MDQEWDYSVDEELCLLEDVCRQEHSLWEEVSVQEYSQWEEEVTVQEEVSPCGAVTQQRMHSWQVGVTVQCADVTQEEPFQCGERVTMQVGQETYQWHNDEDGRCQELSLWEEEVTSQELSPLEKSVTVQVKQLYQRDDDEDDRCEELSPLEKSVTLQVQQGLYQWDDNEDNPYQDLLLLEQELTGLGLSLWEGQRYQALSPSDEDVRSLMHICQWEENERDFGSSLEPSQEAGSSTEELLQLEAGMSEGMLWREAERVSCRFSQRPGVQRQLGPSTAAQRKAAAAGRREESSISAPRSTSCPPKFSASLQGGQAQQGQPAPQEESPSFFRQLLQACCCCCLAQPKD
ncbi:uncharacterized protein LOC135291270 [Passer domesticus]|uniref:uncharacterized protein LOC135291270 n=1 Tax=Passer domesticus TaxID=48849 RepID=UPI0030FEBE97